MVGAPLAGTENQGAVYVIETSDGSICTQDDDCFSTHCVGGICCNTSCDDVCHSCLASEKAAGGVDGTCEPKRAGSPDDACAVEPAASCGTTGACDAAGKCAKHRAGTQCAEPFCSGNSFVGPAVCDGAGDCEPPAATVCKSYMCQDGACQDSCSATADCAPGFYCVDGRCRHQTGLGAACDSKAACQSGHCVDGVCCDRDCNGHCEACAEPDNEGTCIALSAGAPPRVDVRDASSDVNVCARLSCDGVERDVATLPAPAGVVCSPAGCSGDAEVSEGRCDGTGQCLSAPLKECGAYACGSDGDGRPPQCLTTCASIDDCAPDFYCSTNHECRRVEVPGPNARGCNVRPWATPDDWSCLPAALGLAVLGLRRRRMNPQGIPAS